MQTNNNTNNNNNINFIKLAQIFVSVIVMYCINYHNNFDIQYNGNLSLLSYLNFTLIFLFLTFILQQLIEPLLINYSKIIINFFKFLKIILNLILAFFSIGLSMVGFKILKLIVEKLDQIELVKNIILIRIWSKEQLLIELNNLTTFLNLNLTASEKLDLINNSTNFSTLKINLINLLNLKNQPIVEPNLTILEKINLALFNLTEFFYTSPILASIATVLVLSSIYIIVTKSIATVTFFNKLYNLSQSNSESIENLEKTVENLKEPTEAITQIENLKQQLELKNQQIGNKIDEIDNKIDEITSQSRQIDIKLADNHYFKVKMGGIIEKNLTEYDSLKKLVSTFATKHNNLVEFDTTRLKCLERTHNELIANLKVIIPNFGSFFSIEDKDSLKTIITAFNQNPELKQLTKDLPIQSELNQFHTHEQTTIKEIEKKLNSTRAALMADILTRTVPKEELIDTTRQQRLDRYQIEYENLKIIPKK